MKTIRVTQMNGSIEYLEVDLIDYVYHDRFATLVGFYGERPTTRIKEVPKVIQKLLTSIEIDQIRWLTE